MIFRFEWIGKLISINRWHTLIKINNRYLVGTSYAYKKLMKDLIKVIQLQEYETFTEPVDMIIRVSRWKMADTGNIEKPIGDSLQKAGVIKNDRQIRNIVIIRDYHAKGEDDKLIVELYDIGDTFYIDL